MTGSYIGKPSGGKLLRLSLEWEQGIVRGISIRGDFFAHPEDGFDEAEAALAGAPVGHLEQTFARELASRGVTLFGLSPEDVGVAVASILASSNGAS
ncbi:MAG TPA: hypothetical protein VMX33_08525 [bacterium]|nr:hypothetical protein [bacterium]